MFNLQDILSSPEAKATLALTAVIDKLIADIMAYESDTFSASGGHKDGAVTMAEATEMAARLIVARIAPGDNLDGVTLSEIFSEVRPEKDDEQE